MLDVFRMASLLLIRYSRIANKPLNSSHEPKRVFPTVKPYEHACWRSWCWPLFSDWHWCRCCVLY